VIRARVCRVTSGAPRGAARLAAASRDNHLTLRRVARQQRIIELLGVAPHPVPSGTLARYLGVGQRTVERDLARLRESGVPIESVPGAHGGSRLPAQATPPPVVLTFAEIAALIASLAALGPTETQSAGSAMRALVRALAPQPPGGEDASPAGLRDASPSAAVSRPGRA
jgi:predicted DNA-binding transcriptional regulator YafY